MEMNLEMININANLVKEPVFSSFEKNGESSIQNCNELKC